MTHDTTIARLHIDWTRCDARGLCIELLPELLERDEWGFPAFHSSRNGSDIPVPAPLREAATDAVKLCPLLALTLERR